MEKQVQELNFKVDWNITEIEQEQLKDIVANYSEFEEQLIDKFPAIEKDIQMALENGNLRWRNAALVEHFRNNLKSKLFKIKSKLGVTWWLRIAWSWLVDAVGNSARGWERSAKYLYSGEERSRWKENIWWLNNWEKVTFRTMEKNWRYVVVIDDYLWNIEYQNVPKRQLNKVFKDYQNRKFNLMEDIAGVVIDYNDISAPTWWERVDSWLNVATEQWIKTVQEWVKYVYGEWWKLYEKINGKFIEKKPEWANENSL